MEERAENKGKMNEGEPFLFDPSMTSTDDLSAGFRVFYDIPERPSYPARRPARQRAVVHAETTHAYISAATSEQGSRDARAAGAVELRPGRARGRRVPAILPQTTLAAEATALILAIEGTPSDAPLHVHTMSKRLTEGMNKNLRTWEDQGWIGIRDKMILRSAAYKMRHRAAPTTWHLEKKTENKGRYSLAQKRADRRLQGRKELETDLSIPPQYNNSGIRLTTLSQKLAYKAIRGREQNVPRQRTEANLQRILGAVDRITNERPTDSQIWRAIRSKVLPRPISDFLWKATHGIIKCGSFWNHIPGLEERGRCSTCQEVEDLPHILLECRAGGQETAWRQAKDTWERTGHHWPDLTLGALLGAGLMAGPNREEEGENRLLQILISETTWLIWKLRCERVIGHQDEPDWCRNFFGALMINRDES